ncbi:MAG: hypothetical protein C0410_02570 [Anaerolinea sp.]|nr:hypothetical protein [Anaerolinea sp.]
MNENFVNPENQKPKRKYEFGKAFENILFFPFRVIFFVIKWSSRVILGVVIILIIYFSIHGALPMQIPEAQGVSYYQFLAERHLTLKQLHPDVTTKFEIAMFGFVNAGYFYLRVYELPFCSVFPNSNYFNKLVMCSQSNRSISKLFMSARDELKWTDLINLLWETYERFLWEAYVKSSGLQYPDFSSTK